MTRISYARHRFPPDVIRHAVWLYLRFTLSYRDVSCLRCRTSVERSLLPNSAMIARLNRWKRSKQSAIGETIALFKERVRFLEKEEISVPIVEKFRTLADDLEQYDLPKEAWPAMRILASQFSSPQEKENARRRRVKIRFSPSGGRPRDFRRDIAIMIAIDLFEIENRKTPSPNDKFVDFCQQVFVKLGLAADKDVAGLEDRVRRTLGGLDDPGAAA